MKYQALIVAFCLAAVSVKADIVNFLISPSGTSPAIGLSPANEVPPVDTSGGSGDAIFSGITFDTELGILDFSIGYGSFAGFTDLTGEAVAAHIHGPASVTNVNKVVYDFVAEMQHLPAPNPLLGGVIIGSLVLTNELDVADLMAGQFYINIHTTANPDGELRGQLIPWLDVPPTVICPDPVIVECESSKGTIVKLVASVEDGNGDPLTVTWTIDGVEYQTDEVPSGGEITKADVELDGQFGHGDHIVVVAVTDGNSEPVRCRTSVKVVDTVAPEVTYVAAKPNVLWPPNHKMVPVRIRIKASDDCGPVTHQIIRVRSNESPNGTGDGDTSRDWRIGDGLKLLLRAERSGQGDGRVYTVTIASTDVGGNETISRVRVVVPHDQGNRKDKYQGGERPDNDDKDKGKKDKGKKEKKSKGKSKGKGKSGK